MGTGEMQTPFPQSDPVQKSGTESHFFADGGVGLDSKHTANSAFSAWSTNKAARHEEGGVIFVLLYATSIPLSTSLICLIEARP